MVYTFARFSHEQFRRYSLDIQFALWLSGRKEAPQSTIKWRRGTWCSCACRGAAFNSNRCTRRSFRKPGSNFPRSIPYSSYIACREVYKRKRRAVRKNDSIGGWRVQCPPKRMQVCAATGREFKLRPATVSMTKIAKFLKVPKRVIGFPFLVV